jgi:hypothetical protein
MTTVPPPESHILCGSALDTAKSRHERMMGEAHTIIDTGRDMDVVLRLTGGLAVRHYAIDLDFAEREYSDIDLIGLARQAGDIGEVFAGLGYAENVHVALATGNSQRQYFKEARLLESRAHMSKRGRHRRPALMSVPPSDHIDVFLDAMRMDHTIDMRERLDINTYAISPADIFLSKLQIFRLNEKDVHDVVTLVKDVYIDMEDRPGVLNVTYVCETCAADWGLYVDVMSNIDKCLELLDEYELRANQRLRVQHVLEMIQAAMAEESKTLRWRLRSRLGKRVAWRREVEESMGRETGTVPETIG